jgi:hypothetical protein
MLKIQRIHRINLARKPRKMGTMLLKKIRGTSNLNRRIIMCWGHHYFIWKMMGQWVPLSHKKGGMIRNDSTFKEK